MDTLPYLEFRLARQRDPGAAAAPDVAQRTAMRGEAERQWRLEERILDSEEGHACRVDAAEVAAAFATIRGRYDSEASFRADLAANGLSEAILREALGRELRVDAILARVTGEAPAVSLQDAEIFYWQHRQRFIVPEARRASHILLTVNDTLEDKSVTQVRAAMEALASQLRDAPDSFAALALRHSECPTALEDGVLGWVPRGHLYPELEAALFAMQPGECRIVASPLGWHLLRWEAIRAEAPQAFESVADKIVSALQTKRDKHAVAQWLKQLPRQERRLAS